MKSILLIGQSNMAGRGEMGSVEEIHNEKIFMLRKDAWVPMQEPVHTDKPELAGVGLCASFADAFVKRYGEAIGLIPCAMGGSALDEWKKGEPFYEYAVTCAKKAQETSEIIGILWHQGEADCNDEQLIASYESRFLSMLSDLLCDLSLPNSIPVVLGELGDYMEIHNGNTLYRELNHVFLQMAKTHANFALASAKGLVDKGDTLHFDAKSQREFGLRYFAAFDQLLRAR